MDIRYVMWVIDKMADAQNLIDEIDFGPRPPMPAADEAAPAGKKDATRATPTTKSPAYPRGFLMSSDSRRQTALRPALMMPNIVRTTSFSRTAASAGDWP